MKRSPAPSRKGVHLHGSVVVEDGALVRSGAYIEGPVLIREGAEVGPNAYLRGSTVIGPDAHVSHGVEVKNSVLMADASVGHLSYVGDSVLGRGVNFGAGTNVANLRHDDTTVRMTVKGDRVDTGRRKLGAIVGDGAKPDQHLTKRWLPVGDRGDDQAGRNGASRSNLGITQPCRYMEG